jgi:putative intracellular protease/amidase
MMVMDVNILLFDDFETLDIFGPVEILGMVEEYELHYLSKLGGTVTSAQGVKVVTRSTSDINKNGILVIPGGKGTRTLINDHGFICFLKEMADASEFCLSICTGSALYAKAGVLNGKKATSNKRAMKWVRSTNDKVIWMDKARWVVDGKYYTSSGVSAGMDMTLEFVSDRFGRGKAEEIANHMEYIWNDDPEVDPFAK